MLAAAAPFLRVHLASPVGELQLPPGTEARRFADLVTDRFPQHRPDAVVVVARTDPARLTAWAERFADAPQVQRLEPATAAGPGVAVVRLVPVPDEDAATATRLVERLRAERPADFPVRVTGRAALDADFRAEVVEHAPRAAALIALTSYVLLLAMTGSVLLPLKAIVMNTLSPRRLVRCTRPGLPGRLVRRAAGRPHPGRAGIKAAGGRVRPGLRAVHGLRGVPPLPHPGGVPRRSRQRPRRGSGRTALRPDHQLLGAADVHRLHGLRDGGGAGDEAAGDRAHPGRRGRRHPRALPPRARDHDPPRPRQLVVPPPVPPPGPSPAGGRSAGRPPHGGRRQNQL
ncbi:LOW QUALITY PROTEIN: predicted protein, partial [Streptomyces sp. C]